MHHFAFMHRCLDLAQLGRGRVGNGALVGAVLVRESRVIAEAFHEAFGGAHAERRLLDSFTEQVEPTDVLYVNLEPCCHQGMTPPCTDIIIQRGMKTVVFGMIDPDNRVSGQGIEALKKAGVEVIGPIERALCEYFNRGFVSLRTKNRPWITLKMAKNSAGKTSNEDGSRLKITSNDQDSWAHVHLRARHDAILVGIGTVLSDNPSLNIRFDQKSFFTQMEGLNGDSKISKNSFQPYRIILDPQFRIQETANVVCDDHQERTIVCVEEKAVNADLKKVKILKEKGLMLLTVPIRENFFDMDMLFTSLTTPQEQFTGIASVLVEGGPKTWEAFRRRGIMDEEVTLTGPASS